MTGSGYRRREGFGTLGKFRAAIIGDVTLPIASAMGCVVADPVRPLSHFDELATALRWADAERILMVTAYYDESGEYRDGQLVNMSIGSCVASYDAWSGFDAAWKAILAVDGLSCFHMTDFEAWRPPFDFKLADGTRDNERHKRLLKSLLDLMAEHVECFAGFSAGYHDVRNDHSLALEQCVLSAVTHAVHDLWNRYQEPINLVFAKQRHFSLTKISEVVELYNWGDGVGRIGALVWDDPSAMPALQAADILAFEMAKVQRDARPERFPFRHLLDAVKARDKSMTLKWGPLIGPPAHLSAKLKGDG